MDAGEFRTTLEHWISCYDEVNPQVKASTYTNGFQKNFGIVSFRSLTRLELPFELNGTPAEKFWSDAITIAKTGDVAGAPEVCNQLEKILQYMAAEGIPRNPAT